MPTAKVSEINFSVSTANNINVLDIFTFGSVRGKQSPQWWKEGADIPPNSTEISAVVDLYNFT